MLSHLPSFLHRHANIVNSLPILHNIEHSNAHTKVPPGPVPQLHRHQRVHTVVGQALATLDRLGLNSQPPRQLRLQRRDHNYDAFKRFVCLNEKLRLVEIVPLCRLRARDPRSRRAELYLEPSKHARSECPEDISTTGTSLSRR